MMLWFDVEKNELTSVGIVYFVYFFHFLHEK